nr:mucin-2-like [Aedes albopictus]
MEKVVLVILLIAAGTSAEVSVTCSEQFIAEHGPIFPVSGSCEKYLVCSGGQLVEQVCQNGLHFSVELSQCVPETVAKCSGVHWQIIDDRKCNNPDEVSFHPDPHHCARYMLCLGNTTIPRVCAAGLLFNAEAGRCDFPQNVFCDVTCPSGGNDLVFIGDSTGRDCARYFICLNGVSRSARCSSMLYFDLVTGTCRQPEVASCRMRDVHCTAQDELLADTDDCSSYYQCERGLPHYRECEEGQIFSDGRCVPGYCGDMEGTTEGGASTGSSTVVVTESSTPLTTFELTTDQTPTTVDLETSTIIGTTTSDAASTVVTVTSTIVTSEATSNPSTELHTSTVTITSTSTQPVIPSTITTSAIPEVTSTTQTESSSTMTTDVTTESNTSTDSSSTETTSVTSTATPESTTPNMGASTLTSQITTETTGSTQGSSTVATPFTTTAESSTMTTTALTTDSSTPTTQTGSSLTTESTSSTPIEPPSTDPAIVCHGTGIALFPHPY